MRVKTLYDGFANTDIITDSFVNYDTIVGVQIDNQEDVPLTAQIEGRISHDMPWGGLLNNSQAPAEVTVAAGDTKVISFGDIPEQIHLRIHCDASLATTGTLTIKIIA